LLLRKSSKTFRLTKASAIGAGQTPGDIVAAFSE
jgi:hypothetical protein